MPNPSSCCVSFFPAYCFSLSPTYNTWAKLTAADVHGLQERPGFEGQNLYFYLNHPIKWVRLVGVIVAIDVYPTRWIILLDDSSGATLEITCGGPTLASNNAEPRLPVNDTKASGANDTQSQGLTATGRVIDLGGVDIGTVVKIKGGIGSFRGEKQVLLERISILHTTSEEATAWAESTAFRKDILDIPWTVSNGDEQLARKRAEGLDREQKAKEKRKRTREMESAVQEKLGSTEFRRVNAQKKRDRTERGKRSERIDEADYAAQKEISDQQKIKRIGEKAKRAQERSLRKQEFEKSRMHKEGIQSVVDNGKSKDRIQDNPAMMEEEKQPHESDVRIDAQMKKREQAKMRRAEERRLRELEFQRLKRSKDVGEAQRTIAAR